MTAAVWCERAAAAAEAGLAPERVVALLGPPPTEPGTAALPIVWECCVRNGAAVAHTLRDFAEAAIDWKRIEGARRAAIATPRAAARIVMGVPVLTLAMGALLGFDSVQVLCSQPLGWACFVLGAVALGAAMFWSRRLIRWAEDAEHSPGLNALLTGALIRSGFTPERAMALADAAWPAGAASRNRALELARMSGVPPATSLRTEARIARIEAESAARVRANVLSARLTLPLGLGVLPACIAWGVAPVIISIVSGLGTHLG